jgi:hypothetical protein
MDTVQAANQGRYEWPTDVLSSLDLRREDLGVAAWTVERIGDRERPVHVPLWIGSSHDGKKTEKYVLSVVPGAELDEVYTTLLAIDRQGRPVRPVGQRRKHDLGFYPAGRSFSVDVQVPAPRGLYRLDVDAVMRNGATTNLNVLFLNPGQP